MQPVNHMKIDMSSHLSARTLALRLSAQQTWNCALVGQLLIATCIVSARQPRYGPNSLTGRCATATLLRLLHKWSPAADMPLKNRWNFV
jgi:hypothetical protein